jgi:predicted SprT family Zn-dependent metalloprotease
MNKEQIIELVNSFDPAIVVEWFEHNTIAGRAYPQLNKVAFNTKLMHNANYSNTVLHELAHLFTAARFPNAKQAHGPEFRMIMLELGGKPNTYHNYEVQKAKRTLQRVVGKCGCKEHLFTLQASTKSWGCKLCGSKVVMTSEIRKITNGGTL